MVGRLIWKRNIYRRLYKKKINIVILIINSYGLTVNITYVRRVAFLSRKKSCYSSKINGNKKETFSTNYLINLHTTQKQYTCITEYVKRNFPGPKNKKS